MFLFFMMRGGAKLADEIILKYGEQKASIPVMGAKSVSYIYENEMTEIIDIEKEFACCVKERTIDSKPLSELISKDDKVTVIISDITRFWMRQDILCGLTVRYLHEKLHVPFANISVLVALGTHRKSSGDELKKMAGEYAYANVAEVLDHDCDADDLVYVGTTSRGTAVKVNPLVTGRKVICISATVHHIMSGYGGGRKSIVPGVSSRDTIRQNHERALDPVKAMSDIRIGSGKLVNNPIHEDMNEAAGFVDVTFGISIVVNSASKYSGLFCGNFDKTWVESCRYVQKCYGLPIANEADIVIASCGGFPKDINLYQSTKSLFNASRAVKKGGTLILLAECREGGGADDFFAWNKPLQEGRLDEALRKDFTIGGYIFYAACEALRKGKTFLLSRIDADEVKDMGITAFDNIDDLLSGIDFEGKDIYVIPNSGSVMPQLEDDYKRLCGNLL